LQLQLFDDKRHILLFEKSKLGKLKAELPIEELSKLLPTKKNKDYSSWFDNKAKIALQYLKVYTGQSDEKLLESINANYQYRLFLGMKLDMSEIVKDKNLIWQTRKFVSENLDLDQFQIEHIKKWKPEMENTSLALCDATVYESYIHYPTDVVLLWECCQFLHKKLKLAANVLSIRKVRNKYKDLSKVYHVFAKFRRKPKKLRLRLTKRLLKLINKQLDQLFELLCRIGQSKRESKTLITNEFDTGKIATIKIIVKQQTSKIVDPDVKIKDRIVSLFKPYLRPIVRGKQRKNVEFGAKVNMWQVDGLSFIEHHSYSAFHEGARFNQSLAFHIKHFGELKYFGGDRIYASNRNRRIVNKLGISTNFAPKGVRKSDATVRKQEDEIRRIISTKRTSEIEGTFGNDKNHYGMVKNKGRSEKTEKMWLFFAVMLANGQKKANRRASKLREAEREKRIRKVS